MLINWFILQERSTEQCHYPGCQEVSSCWGAQVSLNSGIAGSNAITEIYLFEIVTFVILCQVWDCLCHCAQGKLFPAWRRISAGKRYPRWISPLAGRLCVGLITIAKIITDKKNREGDFTCMDGQCISIEQRCDQTPNCRLVHWWCLDSRGSGLPLVSVTQIVQ